MKGKDRRRSRQIFASLKNRDAALEERVELYGEFLQLDYGIWQHHSATGRCSFKSYCHQVAVTVTAITPPAGSPSDVDLLTTQLVLGCFLNARNIDNLRAWVQKTALRMVTDDFADSATSRPRARAPKDRTTKGEPHVSRPN